jgi:transposase
VCHFVITYPTPEVAARLTWEEFKTFAQTHHHPQPRTWLACYDRLQANYPKAAPGVMAAYQGEAVQLAQMLQAALQNKRANLAQLQALFQQHPDRAIFHSLPGAGAFLAPALLVKFGEDRNRFPSAMAVQALAGTCPVTKRSGKSQSVQFRRACDREFRHIAQQFALTSRAESDWANTYYHEVFARCRSENQALRCLANRWLAIIWKLWQSQQPYEESYHWKQRAAHRRPLP